MAQLEKEASNQVTNPRISDSVAFSEYPPIGSYSTNEKERKNELAASDLFSHFTANIIREETVFTR